MSEVKREKSYFGEYAFNEYLWPISYCPEREIYYMEAPTGDRNGYLGFSFVSDPLAGFDEKTINKLQSILAAPFPDGSFLHMMMYKSPDLQAYIDHMISLRERENDIPQLLRDMVVSRGQFMQSMSNKSLSRAAKTYIHNTVFQLDVKIPLKAKIGMPTEEDYELCNELMVGLKQVLDACGMRVQAMHPELMLRFFGTMLNWGENASWKSRENLWDKKVPLKAQIRDRDSIVTIYKNQLTSGDKYIKMMTPRNLPEEHQFWVTGTFFGDAMTGRGILQNCALSLCIHFPNSEQSKTEIAKKHNAIKYQAFGPMVKWFPELGKRLAGFDAMHEALSAGDRPVQISPAIILFASSEDEMIAATSNVKTSFREKGWIMVDDHFIQLTLLLNHLPFGADPDAKKFLGRYGTVAARHAVQFMPVVGEWKGTGTPAVTFFTRNNQVMAFDFYNSNTNYNAVIAAASGSGKSFLANELICSYLSMGAQFFVIDVGRSYKNLCEEMKGQFIEFTEDSKICLNPFSFIKNFDEDQESLVGTLVAMLQENEELSDPQLAALRIALTEVWAETGKNSEIDQVGEKLRNSPDQRIKDMGNQLFPFTSRGPYGKWFTGEATVDFKNQFTVLELEELKAKPPLQRVVLLMLIS